MARMKAKPFVHRMPVPVALKNGFRMNSPPAAPPVFDPNTAPTPVAVQYNPAAPQRYMYTTNGAPIQQATVPFNGQVHIIVSS